MQDTVNISNRTCHVLMEVSMQQPIVTKLEIVFEG